MPGSCRIIDCIAWPAKCLQACSPLCYCYFHCYCHYYDDNADTTTGHRGNTAIIAATDKSNLLLPLTCSSSLHAPARSLKSFRGLRLLVQAGLNQ